MTSAQYCCNFQLEPSLVDTESPFGGSNIIVQAFTLYGGITDLITKRNQSKAFIEEKKQTSIQIKKFLNATYIFQKCIYKAPASENELQWLLHKHFVA